MNNHYKTLEWPSQTDFIIGKKDVVSAPLVDQEKILLPPMHINLGLIKQFLDKEAEAFKHFVIAFPKLSEANIKGGIFDGPQIKKLMKDHEFTGKLSVLEKRGWQCFISVVNGFLGNKKEENYGELISDLWLLTKTWAAGCHQSWICCIYIWPSLNQL